MSVMWSRDATSTEPQRELQVLSLGLIRTGSSSITEALTILGYQSVHHGITARPQDWPLFSDACDALFPTLPSYNPRLGPPTRAHWDRVFGPCEAVTDMGSFFALSLIAAYPDAKVLLVARRDVDAWFASVDEAILRTTWGLRADFFTCFLAPVFFGGRTGLTIRKLLLGFFGAKTNSVEEIRQNARERYRRHYEEVRAAVPPERLLEFTLEDGIAWEPLCAFLGKEVPVGVPFPRKNEREVHLARIRERQSAFLRMAVRAGVSRALPWVGGAVVVVAGYVLAVRRPEVMRFMCGCLKRVSSFWRG